MHLSYPVVGWDPRMQETQLVYQVARLERTGKEWLVLYRQVLAAFSRGHWFIRSPSLDSIFPQGIEGRGKLSSML